MGQTWDGGDIAFRAETWREAFRVLKPGGYLLAFSATRTYHRMTCAIEDAGFEIRDCIGWHYGSGFPKSLSVEKNVPQEHAAAWKGWGTALKPAWEPVVVARKPLQGTVAANVLKYGTGAINVDGCRVACAEGDEVSLHGRSATTNGWDARWSNAQEAKQTEGQAVGRWPANVILSHDPACGHECAPGCPCAAMDAQSGGDGASRFFSNLPIEADDLVPFVYTAKPGRSERDEGCEDLEAKTSRSAMNAANGTGERRYGAPSPVRSNHHPTVKPVSVMAWCIRLVTPPGGLVLDPFTGSGTTGIAARREGMQFVGCELSEEYAEIARARIRQARGSLFAGGVE
jgi:site-specific DNA-methyltransferase (adenine-specific)